jgi:hypothetical protein
MLGRYAEWRMVTRCVSGEPESDTGRLGPVERDPTERVVIMRRAFVGCGIAAVLAFGASAVPVFGADNGTVNAQVTVTAAPAACITLSKTEIDFSTLSFNAAGSQQFWQALGGPLTVTSCATSTQTLLARGTDAAGTGASWTLTTTAVCAATPVLDEYNLGLTTESASQVYLSKTDASLVSMTAGAATDYWPAIRMPCVGSSGAGQAMSMQYVFTAMIA